MVARRLMAVKSSSKCSCNVGSGLFAVVLFAVGFWVVINGIWTQWNTATEFWIVMLWYIIGFLLLMVGKMAKHGACVNCAVHRK